MEPIINTETDSDANIRKEVNKIEYFNDNFKIEGKNELLLKSLTSYFTEEKFTKILPIITGTSRISLRVIDWFVTNYSKKYQITYKIQQNSEECYINIYNHYRSQLNAYGKKYIDPFCRGKDRILFKVSDTKCVMTNISQLNFFKWTLQYSVLDYIDKYYDNIVNDMTNTLSNTPSNNKRRIFSSNSGKTFKKYDEGISVNISNN